MAKLNRKLVISDSSYNNNITIKKQITNYHNIKMWNKAIITALKIQEHSRQINSYTKFSNREIKKKRNIGIIWWRSKKSKTWENLWKLREKRMKQNKEKLDFKKYIIKNWWKENNNKNKTLKRKKILKNGRKYFKNKNHYM